MSMFGYVKALNVILNSFVYYNIALRTWLV